MTGAVKLSKILSSYDSIVNWVISGFRESDRGRFLSRLQSLSFQGRFAVIPVRLFDYYGFAVDDVDVALDRVRHADTLQVVDHIVFAEGVCLDILNAGLDIV